MEQMYMSPLQSAQSRQDTEKGSKDTGSSSGTGSFFKSLGESTPGKLLSTGGLIMTILLSLLLGLAYVVRSLKNVKLSLKLMLKRDDRAEKKY